MTIQTESLYMPLAEKRLGAFAWSAEEAVAVDDDGILQATATKTSEQTITELDGQPPCARILTVKSTGTAGDIAAKAIVIYGTDINDQPISESITPTADTAINATTTRILNHFFPCPLIMVTIYALQMNTRDSITDRFKDHIPRTVNNKSRNKRNFLPFTSNNQGSVVKTK